MSDPGLERLVDGVLAPGFLGTSVPPWLARRVEAGLAGVVYFGSNVAPGAEVRALSDALHGLRPELLVGSDEEGGDVTRLEVAAGSSYPGNAALGRVDDTALTERVGRAIGADLRAAGVDLDLAPTADVNADPDNPVIGVRSFGADPALVCRHTAAMVAGLQGAGIAACAKHFPGHGSTRQDSHLSLPVVPASRQHLRAVDLMPFAAAVEAGVRAVMTAHVVYPALDEAPATVSRQVLDILRDDLGFDGVVLTDALDMHAIARGVGAGPGAVLALLAGADLLCIGNPANDLPTDRPVPARHDEMQYREVRDAVLGAVRDGTLPVLRLEEARDRVARLAEWTTGSRATAPPVADRTVGLDAARRAVEVRGDVRLTAPSTSGTASPYVLDLRTGSNIAAGRTAPRVLEALRRHDPQVDGCAGTRPRLLDDCLADTTGRPLVLVVGEPGRDPDQARALAHARSRRPDAVVVCTGWPDDRVELGSRAVTTWGAGRVNAEVAAELLLGAGTTGGGVS